MAQRLADAAGSRWHEWVIVASIVALAAIGFAAIWGGSIRRWASDGGDSAEPRTGAASAAGAPRL
jgi:hypothetical protein